MEKVFLLTTLYGREYKPNRLSKLKYRALSDTPNEAKRFPSPDCLALERPSVGKAALEDAISLRMLISAADLSAGHGEGFNCLEWEDEMPRWFVFGSVSGVALFLVFGLVPSASISQNTQLSRYGLLISSLSPSLIPVDATVHEGSDTVNVTLRNVSSKNITAFQVWGASRTTIEYLNGLARTPGEARLAPNDVYVYQQPLRGPQRNTIEVRTVVFEDGTTEGDQTVATQISQFRRGTKLQMEEIIAILDSIGDGIRLEGGVISARSQLERLGSTKRAGGPPHISGGRQQAIQFALRQIDQIEQVMARARDQSTSGSQRLSPDAALSDFKKRYKDMFDRLPE